MIGPRLRMWMLLSLIALLGMSPVGAAAVERLLLSTGNDAISLGLGNNQDDGKSFSLTLSLVTASGLVIDTAVTGFTDQKVSQSRYDTVTAHLSYPFTFTLPAPWQVVIAPTLAITLIGSFGLEDVQNLLHSFKHKKPVVLPAPNGNLDAHIGAGLETTLYYQLGPGRLSLGLRGDHRIGWESEVDAHIGYELGGAVSAAFGYHHTKGHCGYPKQCMQEEQYSGFFFSADWNAHLLFTSYRYYPHSGFSFGFIGIDALAFLRPQTYQKSDLTVTHGLFYEVDGNPLRLGGIEVANTVLTLLYISGPIDASHRFNIGQYSLSYRWQLLKSSRYLHPSLQAGAGVKRYNLVQGFDQPMLEEVRPVLTVEAAVGLGSTPLWIVANTAYSLRVGASLTYVFATGSLHTGVLEYDRHTKAWVFLLGITLAVDHDLSGV